MQALDAIWRETEVREVGRPRFPVGPRSARLVMVVNKARGKCGNFDHPSNKQLQFNSLQPYWVLFSNLHIALKSGIDSSGVSV
jgi:hypothetical protein